MKTIKHTVTHTVEHEYDVPDDAIAIIHFESSYGRDEGLFGALKEMDGSLYIYDGCDGYGSWEWTVFKSLDDLKRHYGSYIIWERD